MSDSIPKGATPIGSKLYVFKSKSNSTDCLISAHGGFYKSTKTFVVPKGVTLYFYGEHGKTLSDPGLGLTDTKAKPVEVLKGGQDCLNYELSKYQGKHNKNNETYEKISKRIDNRDEELQKWFHMVTTSQKQKVVDTFMKAILGSQSMSVVTIRNRWFSSDVYLKDLIDAVRQELPGMRNFHCSFCRSLVGGKDVKSSQVQWA